MGAVDEDLRNRSSPGPLEHLGARHRIEVDAHLAPLDAALLQEVLDQLPRWVWVAGGALSFAAGLMNAVGLLAFGAEAVTHLTGTTTLIAGHLGFGRWDSALHLLGILGAFCLGAVFSGWLIRDEHLRLGRRYTVALGIEALLVLAATQAFFWREPAAYYLLASAVGLQNAMDITLDVHGLAKPLQGRR